MKQTPNFSPIASPIALVLLVARVVAGQDPTPSVQAPGASATAAVTKPPDGTAPLGRVFDLDVWLDLPLGHGVSSLLETVEATAITDRIDNGGLFTGEPGRLGIHGSSWTQVSYRFGDMDITDPAGLGTPLFLLDLGALRAVEVSTGLMPVEDGGPGAVVRLVPRRPGDAWHGALGAEVAPVGLQSATPAGPPAIGRYGSFASGRFRLDGPLVKDRLSLLVAGALTRGDRLERDDPTPLKGRESSAFAHLVWTASPRDEVRFLTAAQGVEHPNPGRARFGASGSSQTDRFFVLQSTWERRAALPFSLSAGYARGSFSPDTAGLVSGSVLERLRDGPVPLVFPGAGTRETGTLAARATPAARNFAGASHALRFGAGTSWARASTRPAGPGGLSPETVNGAPARVWDYDWAGPESRWQAFDFTVYAADAIRWGRASFDLGLRFDSTNGWAEAGEGRIAWRGLSPRLSTRIRLTEGGALSFVGGFARYRHRLPLELLAYGDSTARQGSVYRWQDLNADRRFDADERGPLVALAGPGGSFASIDPQLGAPRTQEVVAGLEYRFGRVWTAHFLGIHRRERNLVAALNVGAPLSAYTVSYVPDLGGDILGGDDDQLLPLYDRRPETFGQDRYLLTNTGENALGQGAEVALQRSGERFMILLGATAYRSDGPGGNRGFQASENDQGLIGERLENPNATTFSRGRLFFDRAFTIKLSSRYRAPGDVRLGFVARYQDGQPFSRLVIAPFLNQGAEAVQAIPNGRSRFTYTLTVDARVEKGFRIGGLRLAAVVEAFNLTNGALEVEEDVLTGPGFRTITAVQPPRIFRLGMRLDF